MLAEITGNDVGAITAIGIVIATVLGFALKWRAQAKSERKTDHKSMADFNDTLMKRVTTVEAGLAECQKHHRECEEDRATDRQEFARKHAESTKKISGLYEEMRGLKAQVALGRGGKG